MKVLSSQKIIKIILKNKLVVKKTTSKQGKPEVFARVDEARVDNAKIK